MQNQKDGVRYGKRKRHPNLEFRNKSMLPVNENLNVKEDFEDELEPTESP